MYFREYWMKGWYRCGSGIYENTLWGLRLIYRIQYECSSIGGPGRRDGSIADRHQGVEGEENPFGCEEIFT